MTTVLVTGANGFIGRYVTAQLQASGLDVRGAVRRTEALTALAAGIAPVVVPDNGVESWQRAIESVHAVVHLIGRAHRPAEQSSAFTHLYRAANVAATSNLVAAVANSPVERVVLVSTAKVMGEASAVALDEALEPCPRGSYATTKLEGERALLTGAVQHGFDAVILRPPIVYGPEATGNMGRLVQAIERGLPLPLGRADSNRRSLISIGNLTSAIRCALSSDRPIREVFFVADADPPSTRDLAVMIGEALGRHPRLISVPRPVLRVAGALAGKGEEVHRLLDSFVVSTTRIQRHLGWLPTQSTAEGIQEMLRTGTPFGPSMAR